MPTIGGPAPSYSDTNIHPIPVVPGTELVHL